MENFYKNHKNIIYIFSKILNCLTKINIYLINNKTSHFLERDIPDRKKKEIKKLYFLHFRSDLEQSPDPYQNEIDPKHCTALV